MYFDEDMLLDIRLNILDKYVKKFIICEAEYNHNGLPKKLNFNVSNERAWEVGLTCGGKVSVYIETDEIKSEIYENMMKLTKSKKKKLWKSCKHFGRAPGVHEVQRGRNFTKHRKTIAKQCKTAAKHYKTITKQSKTDQPPFAGI